MANALTALRLVLAWPFTVCMASADRRHALVAGVTLALAIATDLLDGAIARRRGTVTPAGAIFDHTADFVFVTSGMAAGALRGAFPWVLPILVTTAFAQYVVDSYLVHGQRRLHPSRLGRYNGVLYFAPPVGDILARLGFGLVQPFLTGLVWVLVTTTVLSMGERLFLSWRWREEFSRGSVEK